ncbi:MAG: radical SAM protein [Nanoarchaeota archaeon]|nr:radical SAM protein [Nanoarchaeota archaeon]
MKIYGPVPSWRLGNSLGIDLVDAPMGCSKLCSFDCLYCQLGHKGIKTGRPLHYRDREDEFDLLEQKIDLSKPDYITFSGQGEPTLNLNLGEVADRIKEMTDIPLAILTNGSFLDRADVRRGLDRCDLVIAKLDTADEACFQRINQPYSGMKIHSIIRKMMKLRTDVAIQTLLFSYGRITNADKNAVDKLISAYRKINENKPIRIFLGTAYRPTDLMQVRGISDLTIEKIADRINNETGIEVIYYKINRPKPVAQEINAKELKKEVLKLIERRPCTMEDINTRFQNPGIPELLHELVEKGCAAKKRKEDRVFYTKRDDKKC